MLVAIKVAPVWSNCTVTSIGKLTVVSIPMAELTGPKPDPFAAIDPFEPAVRHEIMASAENSLCTGFTSPGRLDRTIASASLSRINIVPWGPDPLCPDVPLSVIRIVFPADR